MNNKERKLKHKHQMFADLYLQTLNATRSYMDVYHCSYGTAKTNGNKLLTNTDVQEYIEERFRNAEKKKVADADEVLEFLTSTLRGEVKDQLGFETSVKDRLKAGELLGKRYKLFEEKQKTTDSNTEKVTPKIEINVVDNSNLESVMYERK